MEYREMHRPRLPGNIRLCLQMVKAIMIITITIVSCAFWGWVVIHFFNRLSDYILQDYYTDQMKLLYKNNITFS